MALFEKDNSFIQIGNRGDICFLCAQKEGIRHIEARNTKRGLLEGQGVIRPTRDLCYCVECLKEYIIEFEEKKAERNPYGQEQE